MRSHNLCLGDLSLCTQCGLGWATTSPGDLTQCVGLEPCCERMIKPHLYIGRISFFRVQLFVYCLIDYNSLLDKQIEWKWPPTPGCIFSLWRNIGKDNSYQLHFSTLLNLYKSNTKFICCKSQDTWSFSSLLYGWNFVHVHKVIISALTCSQHSTMY